MNKINYVLFCLVFISKLNAQTIPFKWVNGSDVVDQQGVYGTKLVAAPGNIPGARYNSASWVDASGNLWLFGGQGVSTSTISGYLNDLWKYDVTSNLWTWVAGTSTVHANGQYGTMGVPSSTNSPGSRQNAYTWADNSGNLWLFGGMGHAANGSVTYLNDLWKYNISTNQWTWMTGANTGTPASVYGTQGVAAAGNTPGGRFGGAAWIDNSNNLWLFGGQQVSNTQRLNDLWKYSIGSGQWTWVSGSNTINQNGNYGTKGVVASTNMPGARQASVNWKDQSGNFWLFGGDGFDATGTSNNYLNDLWKYDVTTNNWVWLSGSNGFTASAVYGSFGVPTASTIPGARQMSIGWTDNSNNLWLFGGWGYIGPPFGRMDDLWKYNISTNQFTWMAGPSFTNQPGVYGTQGVASATNIPGARRMSTSWKDNNGKLWLFGGTGIDKNNVTSSLNDLWMFDVSGTTGLNKLNKDEGQFIVYPNPSKEIINLKLIVEKSEAITMNYKIYNSIGQIVLSGELSKDQSNIFIEKLTTGIYFIEINSFVIKFIKE